MKILALDVGGTAIKSAIIDKDGNVKTTGRGEGVITYTVTLENGKKVTQSIGIKVVFTPRQWFIYIFLFGWLWY